MTDIFHEVSDLLTHLPVYQVKPATLSNEVMLVVQVKKHDTYGLSDTVTSMLAEIGIRVRCILVDKTEMIVWVGRDSSEG